MPGAVAGQLPEPIRIREILAILIEDLRRKSDSIVRKAIGIRSQAQGITPAAVSSDGVSYALVHSFSGADGSQPQSALIQATDGNFYGATTFGGTFDLGTVFKIDSQGNVTVLHSFSGPLGPEGAGPTASLIQGRDGSFYGTSFLGGVVGGGTVFKIDQSGRITVLHAFSGTDGQVPLGVMIQGSDGFFYGTTALGGNLGCTAPLGDLPKGCGTIFKIDSMGNFVSLYSFAGMDGEVPFAGLTQSSDGSFYGTTLAGGSSGLGTVFRMDSSGHLTIVHSFTGVEGGGPAASLLRGRDGRFYGTTSVGGNWNSGTIYSVDPVGNVIVLHSFNGVDGASSQSALIQTSDGTFYGTTQLGGNASCTASNNKGCGTVFKLDTSGNVTVLHAFAGQPTDGSSPQYAGLIQATDGTLYGTTQYGGSTNKGVVLQISGIPVSPPATPTTGVINIQIVGLPSGSAANVSVTSTGGFSAIVTGNQSLQVLPGTYTVAANLVPIGNVYYGAYPMQQSVTVIASSTTPVQVAYNAIIPRTTKTPDQPGVQGLVASSDGSMISFPTTSQIAQSLTNGDVLAIGITPSTPNGLLRKVITVGKNGSQIVAMTAPATLSDAFQQASVSFTTTITPQHSHIQTLRPNVTIRADYGNHDGVPSLAKAAAPQSCPGDSTTLMELSQTPLIQDQIGTITATGSIQLCPSLEFDWNIGGTPPGLNSLTATISFAVQAHVAISGQYDTSFDQRFPIATIISDPIPVVVAGLPIVLTPTLTFYLGAAGNVSAGFSVGATENASVTGGISYSNGQLSRVFNQTNNFTVDPLGVDAQLTTKAYVGLTADLTVDGVLSPEFSPDAYLQFQVDPFANPWWTLTAGLEGSASVKLGIFGVDLADFNYADLFNFSKTIAQASAGFSTAAAAPSVNSVTPNSVLQGAADLTLTIVGSNFVPGATTNFNGTALVTTFVSATQLTALLPGNNLTGPGTFSITVANPDTVGATSTAFAFVVQPAAVAPTIQSLTFSAPSLTGGSSLTGTIILSGPAPAGGVQISLSSDNASVLPSGPVTAAAGQTTATFTVSTTIVSSSQTANITATLGSSTATATLTVLPQVVAPTVQTLTLSSPSVTGGSSVIGTVTLSGLALSGGVQVTLSSDNPSVQVPASLTIASGQSTATFTLATTAVTSMQMATITARVGTSSATATLTVLPSGAGFSLQGRNFVINGTVTISGKALAFEIQAPGASDNNSFYLIVDNGVSLSLIQFTFGMFAKAVYPGGMTVNFSGPVSTGVYTDLTNPLNPTFSQITAATIVINFTSLSSGSTVTGNLGLTISSGQVNGTIAGTLTSIF